MIRAVKAPIKQCAMLLECVVLTAARLEELVDLEIDQGGYAQEWKEKYAGFGEVKTSMHASPKEGDALVDAVWDLCAEVFTLCDALNNINDSSLYEKFCSGEEESPSRRWSGAGSRNFWCSTQSGWPGFTFWSPATRAHRREVSVKKRVSPSFSEF